MECPRCKQVGTVECCTCGYTYSQPGANPRESMLSEQLDWLTVDHDDLRRDISEYTSSPKYHPSMTVIDRWEEESIARIRSIAVRARRALVNAFDQHILQVKQALNTLTPLLREARQYTRSYNGTDIQQWANRLHELKKIPPLPVEVDKENKIYGITVHPDKQKRVSFPTNCLTQGVEDQSDPRQVNKTSVDGYSFEKSRTVTPGGVLIIREGPFDGSSGGHTQQTREKETHAHEKLAR